MRRTRLAPLLVLSSLAALPAGCSNQPAQPPIDGPPVVEVDEDLGRITFSDEIAGRPVKKDADGPWALRSTASTRTKGDGAVRRRDAERMTLGASGGGAAPGAPAKSGAEPDAGDDAVMDLEESESGPVADPADAPPVAKARAPAEKAELADDKRAWDGGNAPVQTLKAGATDDNADFDKYLEFLRDWPQKEVVKAGYQPLDVRDRKFIRLLDADGRPVPGAVIGVTDVDADRRVSTMTTYGDGRAPFYPRVGGTTGVESIPVPTSGYLVEARIGDSSVRTRWDANGDELVLRLDDALPAIDEVRLDALFLIDTTGSMGDEIASIKASLLKVTEQLRSLEREFDLRYGAVLFRDIGDEYLTATHEFTSDIEAFDGALKAVRAAGGGDGPESVNQGLAQAVDGVDWRDGAAKVVFLIGDAPPHMDYPGDTWYGESLRAAVAKGIRIHSVAASGLDGRGTLVWRQVAQFTRGKFIFIEYGRPGSSAASHGVKGNVKNNNLEDILFEQIRDEVATFGR